MEDLDSTDGRINVILFSELDIKPKDLVLGRQGLAGPLNYISSTWWVNFSRTI